MSDDHHIPTAEHEMNSEPGERLARPFTRFAKLSSSGGIVLLLMTGIAMIWANTDFESYNKVFNDAELRITIADNPHHAPGGHDEAGHDDHGDSHDESDSHEDHGHTEDDQHDSDSDHAQSLEDHVDDAEHAVEDVIAHTQDHANDDHGDESNDDAHSDDDHASDDAHAWHPLPKTPYWWQGHSIAHWINDLLMAIFFLVVGLEIKREILVGELASPKRAALPIFGAIGGMVGPALIFASLNFGKDSIGGWGIPMATDIAFAVGILAMLGSRIPNSLKIFLTSLAIVDDLGALVVIAVFYTENLSFNYLGYAGVIIAILVVMNLLRVRWITLYLVFGLPLWYFVYMSGVHATIAGVMLALTIPAHARVNAVNFSYSTRKALEIFNDAHDDADHDVKQSSMRRAAVNAIIKNSRQVLPPLHRIEHVLHPWAAFVIIPIFALANAGIPVSGSLTENLNNPAAIGIILGLFIGKPLGIILLCWFACTIKVAALPRGVSWRHILGAGMLGGIGFTMAIFIANLAYAGNQTTLEHAKLAILVASAISAIGGAAILLSCKGKPEPEPETLGPVVKPDAE